MSILTDSVVLPEIYFRENFFNLNGFFRILRPENGTENAAAWLDMRMEKVSSSSIIRHVTNNFANMLKSIRFRKKFEKKRKKLKKRG